MRICNEDKVVVIENRDHARRTNWYFLIRRKRVACNCSRSSGLVNRCCLLSVEAVRNVLLSDGGQVSGARYKSSCFLFI